MSAQVTAFFSRVSPPVDEVNRFLEDNSYDVADVRIQFMTTRVQLGREGGTGFEGVDDLYEAFVTHPG